MPPLDLTALARKPRLRRPKLSALVFEDGYHVQGECVRALRALGHEADAFDLRAVPHETLGARLTRLVHAVAERRVDFVVSINYVGFDRAGAFAELVHTLRLPVALWFVDSPLFFATGYIAPPETASSFLWDRTHAKAFAGWGAHDVVHLPLGCEPTRFAPPAAGAQNAAAPCTYAFVGSSMRALEARWRQRLHADELAMAEAMAARLRQDRSALHALVRDPQPPVDRRTLALAWANCAASRPYRTALLRALPQPALHVYGDDGWAQELPAAHHGGPVAYGEALAARYRASAVNVNATIVQMPSAVNQRVFDVPAAGGFVLTDAQPELHEAFDVDAGEAVCYANGAELAELAARYAADARARAQVVARAQRRILAEHTYVHRLAKVVAHLRRAHGPARAPRSQKPVPGVDGRRQMG